MPPLSFNQVAHEVDTVLERQYPSAMRYRLSQTMVTIMAGDQQVESFALNPLLSFRLHEPHPGKRRRRLRLVGSVHTQRVMHSSTAELVAITASPTYSYVPGSISRAWPWLFRQTLSASAWLCPPLCVPWGPASTTSWVRLFRRRQKIESRRRQSGGLHGRTTGFQFVPLPHSFHSQQPDRLLAQFSSGSFVVATMKQNRAGSQRIEQMLATIAPWIKEPSAVIIAESRWRACHAQQVQSRSAFFSTLLRSSLELGYC